jgi:hypothetical protein
MGWGVSHIKHATKALASSKPLATRWTVLDEFNYRHHADYINLAELQSIYIINVRFGSDRIVYVCSAVEVANNVF